MSNNITSNWSEAQKRDAKQLTRFYGGVRRIETSTIGQTAKFEVPRFIPVHTRSRTSFKTPNFRRYIAEKICVELANE